MTEPDAFSKDLFYRQALLAGESKVPALWAAGGRSTQLSMFQEHADADVGLLGKAMSGIPTTESSAQAKSLPWAVRYLQCSNDMRVECREHAYQARCWVDRPDYTPSTEQLEQTGGRAKWHPGNRVHQLKGRNLAFTVLLATEQALSKWMAAENFILPDAEWHVEAYYKNMQEKVKSLPEDVGDCYKPDIPDRLCKYPMKGVTEWTPRAFPEQTSIRSIAKSGSDLGPINRNAYDPPDVRHPDLDVPDEAFEYLAVVENGVDYVPTTPRKKNAAAQAQHYQPPVVTSFATNDIRPGLGWMRDGDGKGAPDNCDGTYDSFCGREERSSCLLYAHADNRAGFFFDGFSGWIVLNLKDVLHGVVIAKFDEWLPTGSNKKTNGWTCENNATSCESSSGRGLSIESIAPEEQIVDEEHSDRELKYNPPPLCETLRFEFAVDGKVTSWDLEEFLAKKRKLQRVVSLWTLLDDENYTKGKPRDVELALRTTGCGRLNTFHLSHVYWA